MTKHITGLVWYYLYTGCRSTFCPTSRWKRSEY